MNYEREAPAPERWLTFLRQLWRDDDQSIAALHEWFGYLLLSGDSVAAPTLASLGTNDASDALASRSA